jgi:hypothetical protein
MHRVESETVEGARADVIRATSLVLAVFVAGCSRKGKAPDGDPASTGSSASALTGDGGGAAFGATCAHDAECASGVCFAGKQGAFCSTKCSKDADCPSPPGAGVCSKRGFCKNK